MPTYVYRCGKCKKTYEIIQPISAPHLRQCQLCQSADFRRVITTPMIRTSSKVFNRTPCGTVGDFGAEL